MVATYNTGAAIDTLIASLDRQTMPATNFEVVLVDDGSTDDTLDRLRSAAADRPHLHVESIANSGWPGRPRNVGLSRAQGDYVFFADHDDEFYPRALERMHATAVANDADVVYGKLVRTGRPTPYWPIATRDVAVADLAGDVLLSRTVHKLYRRAFLEAHDIRFLEGRVRLEDHHFMAQVLPRARVISVLASEPCYRWIHRSDGTNTSDTKVDPEVYWPWYAKQLEVWRDVAGPGPQLDAARLVTISQAFSRFVPGPFMALERVERTRVFDAVRAIVLEHVPPELDERLAVLKRLRVMALRDGDQDAFEAVQSLRSTITFTPAVSAVAWDGGTLSLTVQMSLTTTGGRPFELDRDGEHLVLKESSCPQGTSPAARRLLPSDAGTLAITVCERASGMEWPVHSVSQLHVEPCRGGVAVRVTCTATIDLERAAFGRPLGPGSWDLMARVQFLGEQLRRRVRVDDPETLPTDPTAAHGFRLVAVGQRHNLTLTTLPPGAERIRATAVRWRGEQLELRLEPAPVAGDQVLAIRRSDSVTVRTDVTTTSPRAVRVAIPSLQPGEIVDVSVQSAAAGLCRIGYAGADDWSRRPVRIYATANDSLSVKYERGAAAKAGQSRLRRRVSSTAHALLRRRG
ncbi:glycosyltransferase family 2 protein [Angustibacter luteus]|uniref:glycosyltransferase family 2 protein n=1 Tax=Angustibacter luteus TaxID=658456 RepID=UPI0031F047F8